MSTWVRWRLPVLWAAGILVLTSWPNPPAMGFGRGSDKMVHAVLYAVLGWLAQRAATDGRGAATGRMLAMVWAGIALFGALDEWHQQWIPSRSAERADWMADAAGGLAGIVIGEWRARRRQERRA